jgi:DNA helicase-2/ATP-dependent DNA helicase PcrA
VTQEPLLRPDEEPYARAPPEVMAALGDRVPTVQQWRAITHPLAPGVIVAGAGSGKTAVMAARLVYLALVAAGRLEAEHGGAMPSQVLCLTFTNKAAEELSRRVLQAVSGLGLSEGEEPTVLTYHAFAARLLDDYGLRMGMEPGPMLLSEAQKWQLMISILDEEDLEFEAWEIRSEHVVGQALSLADQMANHLVEPDGVIQATLRMLNSPEVQQAKGEDADKMRTAARKRIELAELVRRYRARKQELRAIDYGDQIADAVRLVEGHPDIVDAFRERYPVVLLDEYQDTNHAQARLLSALCGSGYPVLAVGDPDQNIYAWRGASLHNILRFEDDFGRPQRGDARRPLYVNFRSGRRILDAANRVIDEVPPHRRAPDKELRPHPDRGEGAVRAFFATDADEEGREIARQARALHDEGVPWQEMAVLGRKSRLFEPIVAALRAAEVPVEVVDLGGLLRFPEVVDVLAWLRLLDDPARNVPLARILMGPRWRIGYRDLRVLAEWSARQNRSLQDELADDEDLPGEVAFALAESLDHVDEMEELSPEARERLVGFRGVLGSLRDAAKGSLGDLVEEIVERTGMWRELEAAGSAAAVSVRRNLLNLIQHVAAFSPTSGEASLSTLIGYLDTALEQGDDLEPAQPSHEDTVKVLTIHKAKGLEWDAVFVPGVAADAGRWKSSMFPDVQRQPNPLTQPAMVPFEIRGDRDDLPRFEGTLRDFRGELKARGLEEERRLCYVSLTRARKVLTVSGAHWYETPQDPYSPGVFLDEVATHPSTEVLFRAELPEESPLLGRLAARVTAWPPPSRPDDADELFPAGWHAAAVRAVEDPASVEGLVSALGPGERAEVERLLAADRDRAALIASRTRAEPGPVAPATVSVSGVLEYLGCPKRFYWSQVRPLPRRPNPSARLGSEVHRWIELRTRGQASLLEEDDLPDLAPSERAPGEGKAHQLREAFLGSRFEGMVPLYTERPFLLYLDGTVVRGRIDAVFGEPDGKWEVVDYKTGRVPTGDDPLVRLQLDLYALACIEVWGKRPQDLTLTYFYLEEGKEVTRPAGDPAETRARVVEALKGIAAGEFDPVPGPYCGWCDFRAFCQAGQDYLARTDRGGA